MSVINNSKSLNNSFLYKTTKKSNATAKSVLEKIKSLSSSIGNNTKGSLSAISDTNSTRTPDFEFDNTFSSNSQNVNYNNNHKISMFWNIIRYSLIIIISGFIILNILAVMNLLTPNLEKKFEPVLKFLGYTMKTTIIKPTSSISPKSKTTTKQQQSSHVTSEVKNDIDDIENDIENDIDKIEKDTISKEEIDKIFNDSQYNEQTPKPDDSDSITQTTSKSGFCFIGEDRGFRSCIKVGVNDTCMSGDIFPTEDICVNPNLRM